MIFQNPRQAQSDSALSRKHRAKGSKTLREVTCFARDFYRLQIAYDFSLDRLLYYVQLVLTFSVLSHAAAAQSGPLSGFSFLRLEPSARATALGGSFSAVYGDDVNALFYNPALINKSMHRQISLSYLNHIGGLNAGFVAYGREIPDVGTFVAGVRFLGWGDIQAADENGSTLFVFGASDVALTLGHARPYNDRLRYGASMHLILSNIDIYYASAIAADIGVFYDIPVQQLSFSASVNNLGITLKSFGDLEDELPLDVRIGVAKKLRYVPLLISVTGYNLHNSGDTDDKNVTIFGSVFRHLAVGGEFQFSEAFNVRFGYNHRRHESLKMNTRLDLAGFSMGFGLKIMRFRLDYAFNSWSSLGSLHQFTVRTVI